MISYSMISSIFVYVLILKSIVYYALHLDGINAWGNVCQTFNNERSLFIINTWNACHNSPDIASLLQMTFACDNNGRRYRKNGSSARATSGDVRRLCQLKSSSTSLNWQHYLSCYHMVNIISCVGRFHRQFVSVKLRYNIVCIVSAHSGEARGRSMISH